jgi:drug/metabolite transporter (DMT)-like permease
MRTVAWLGGLVIVAGLIFLAVAGFPGAVPILISGLALVAMVGLGGAMGGRHTPNVRPVPTTAEAPVAVDDASHRPPVDDGTDRSPTDP